MGLKVSVEDLKKMAKDQKIVLPMFPNRFLEWIRTELKEDEELKTFCVAKEDKKEGSLFVTNKRMAFTFMKMLGGMNTVSVDLDKIDTVTTKASFSKEEIEVYTASGKVSYVLYGIANKLEKAINEARNEFKNKTNAKEAPNISVADELLKFKQLLDMGVLTQEEFDKKKNELLK